MNHVAPRMDASHAAVVTSTTREMVTMMLAGQEVAIPVEAVQDVLGAQFLTPVPMSAPEIAGLLNLRGRIVTAIDLRRRLGIASDGVVGQANIVIDHQGELYSLLVDTVGDVLNLPRDSVERDLSLLDPRWRAVASGIYVLKDRLLVVLEVDRVLELNG